MRVQARFFRKIGCEIPVVPAVIAAEQNQIFSRGTAGDSHGHSTRFTPGLCITHHLRTRNAVAEFFRQLDFQFMIDGVHRALRNLLLNGIIHHWVGIPQQDCADAADPVNVLIPVNVSKSRAFCFDSIDR